MLIPFPFHSNRRLCVAGYSGHVILFKFRKQECLAEMLVLEIPITYENTDEADVSPECEFIPRTLPKPDAVDTDKKVNKIPRSLSQRVYINT